MMTLGRNIIKNVLLLAGFALSSGYVDLSRNKTTSQSSTRYCGTSACKYFYLSSNAVDRDENTCTGIRVIGKGTSAETAWWKVDMGDIYSIYSISILFREYPKYVDRQRGRFAGFSLYVSETRNRNNYSLCYKDGPDLPPLNFTTTCTGYGRYVMFYNERLYEVTYPEGYEDQSYADLCEVRVTGCNETSYGRNCSETCSVNCENQRCNIVNGACLRCKAGWTGNVCENKCPGGWYGLDCKQQCSSHCINNEVCNHVTGGCDNGCAGGWIGINCDEPCKDGNYGPGCIYNCSDNCLHDVACNKQTGHCNTGCKPGYRGNLCNTACMPGYYGNQCKELCSQNCLNDKTCNQIDGVCKGGCKNGYVGERCDQSCQHGYFGKNCTGICSMKCISTCKFTDGSCDCAPGWRDPNCSEECLTGDFGVNCQHRCSGHCIQNESCSRFDGSCPTGCKTPYMGLRCEYNYLPVSRAVDDDRNHIAITIGFGVSQTINMIALSAFVFLFRGRIFKICRRHNNERPPNANVAYETQNIQEVSVNKSDYQELTVSRDNTEYQSNQMSDIPSSEEGNTYQNLAFTAV